MKNWILILALIPFAGCENGHHPVEGWHDPVVPVSLYYTMRGRVWAPGGDQIRVLDVNRMPVPDALVAFFREEPEPPPSRYYCNRCVELPAGTLHTRSDVDGSFSIQLRPQTEYWMVVQKGEFRRVTRLVTGKSGEVWDSEEEKSGPRPSRVTLPSEQRPREGTWTPRILILKGRGEPDMHVFWQALGFRMGVDVEEIRDMDAEWVVSSPEMLSKYSILLATCGDDATYLTKPHIQENLRSWVRGGGKLFVDDFAYDWAEQLFPGFLSFKVDFTLDYAEGICGGTERAPDVVGRCVNYECYDAAGYAGDDQLAEWMEVVNRYSSVDMKYGCNVIHELGTGEQGICKTELDPRCRDGLFYDTPRVWIYGTSFRYRDKPLTVSWNYHCGKVMYTVLHTHAEGDTATGYELLLQEKVMLYLFMELQTCTSPNLVE